MEENDWKKVLEELKENLLDIERRANNVSGQLNLLCKISESLKMDILKSKLEKERRHLAQGRGFTALRKNKAALGISLGAAVARMFIGRALGGNKNSALDGGLRAFDASLQDFGETQWAVSLDRKMLVMPRDQIIAGRSWVTWESFMEALQKLRQNAFAGQQLGKLEAIISVLKQDPRLNYLIKSSELQVDAWTKC